MVPDFRFQFANADTAYVKLMQHVIEQGERASPRGQATREIRGLTFVIENPCDNVITSIPRNLNYSFMNAEWLWIMTGSALRRAIQPFNKGLEIAVDRYGDNNSQPTFSGAYGPKWIEQMPYILDTLTADPDSRQAIVNIWRDRPRQSADQPCTLNWQFFIRNGFVEMHTHMRSNDLWLGTPYDLYNFTQIQRWVAMMLKLPVGGYYHHVGSLHLYERNLELAQQVALFPAVSPSRERFISPMADVPLEVLQRLLLGAAFVRENVVSTDDAERWLTRLTHELRRFTVDGATLVLPLLLLISLGHGRELFRENSEHYLETAADTPWYEVLARLT